MGFVALDSVPLQSPRTAGAITFNLNVSELAAVTDSINVSLTPVSQPPPARRDYWDCDGWGRIIPGSCIRR